MLTLSTWPLSPSTGNQRARRYYNDYASPKVAIENETSLSHNELTDGQLHIWPPYAALPKCEASKYKKISGKEYIGWQEIVGHSLRQPKVRIPSSVAPSKMEPLNYKQIQNRDQNEHRLQIKLSFRRFKKHRETQLSAKILPFQLNIIWMVSAETTLSSRYRLQLQTKMLRKLVVPK